MRYIFTDCGCEYSGEKISRLREQGIIGKNIIKCPIHKTRIARKISECIDCGVDIELNTNGGRQLRCTVCQVNENTRRHALYARNDKKDDPEDAIRKDDCKFYLSRCLQYPGGRLFKNACACAQCTEYEPMDELDAIDFIKGNADAQFATCGAL